MSLYKVPSYAADHGDRRTVITYEDQRHILNQQISESYTASLAALPDSYSVYTRRCGGLLPHSSERRTLDANRLISVVKSFPPSQCLGLFV